MKVLVIWDLHWLNIWKKLVENECDHIVFLWDYVDSYVAPNEDILNNLKEIIEYKKNNLDKVTLLLGNHDIQYIYKEWNTCSWFRANMFSSLNNLFNENLKLFQIAKKIDDYYFTHAWVTQDWIKHNQEILKNFNFSFANFETLNDIFNTHNRNILFQCWPNNWWYDNVDWPLWARRLDNTSWVFQVVWHTPVQKLTVIWNNYYCDILEHWDWKLIIIDTNV